jgi:hypothetical protein
MAKSFEEIPFAPGGHGWLGHNGEFRRNRMGMLRLLAHAPDPLMRLRAAPLAPRRLPVSQDHR